MKIRTSILEPSKTGYGGESGEPIPKPRGLEYYVLHGDAIADPGDLITTLSAAELLAAVPLESRLA